ncbi:MAG: TetR/AcrR family transcriptional regulator [Anaerolineae bacterium]|nr:TetR/AcrR family transcriptional regulator [Anaerolineae bacterium]
MSKKLDPRVKRTRQLLRDSLMALIVERGFEAITVKDITDRATLNHATFYLHYGNKQELLTQSMTEIFDELRQAAAPPSLDDPQLPVTQSTILFEHVAAYADFYRAVLGASGIPTFAAQLRAYLAETIRLRLLQIVERENPEAMPLIDMTAQFSAGAYLSVIVWWLEGGMVLAPDELAAVFIKLTVEGVYSALQLKSQI